MFKSLVLAMGLLSLTACMRDAQVASQNLSYAADNFRILRRVIFYNAITDSYMLSIEGFCSIEADRADNQLEVTCKTKGRYKKHFLGLSDNTTYFVEQLESKTVSTQHYRVIFKPASILPSIEVK